MSRCKWGVCTDREPIETVTGGAGVMMDQEWWLICGDFEVVYKGGECLEWEGTAYRFEFLCALPSPTAQTAPENLHPTT